MNRAILLLNGEIEKKGLVLSFLSTSDTVLCADGGAKYAFQWALTPNLILGDFDSIDSGVRDHFESLKIPFERFPEHKNATDGELLIQRALTLGYNDLILIGALGGRVDQLLGHFTLLERFSRTGARLRIITPSEEIECIRTRRKCDNLTGYTASIIPATSRATVTLHGFEYPLTRRTIQRGSTLGISNSITKKRAQVEVHSGAVFLIISKEKK